MQLIQALPYLLTVFLLAGFIGRAIAPRAARVLGADAVGMSTAPETILARHAGLKVAALSLMTNHAAGLVPGMLSHEQTITVATEAADKVRRLLRIFLERYE